MLSALSLLDEHIHPTQARNLLVIKRLRLCLDGFDRTVAGLAGARGTGRLALFKNATRGVPELVTRIAKTLNCTCLLYTSDAADE